MLRLTLLSALPLAALSYRIYLQNLPNGAAVPVPPGISSPGATKGICEAWGHTGCSGEQNELGVGESFKDGSKDGSSKSKGPQWTVAFCGLDSDSDGKSNGDELGDPSCAWKGYPNLPDFETGISHPGYQNSVTPRASCTFLNPAAPSGFTVVSKTSNGATLSWLAADPLVSCVSEYQLTVTVGSQAPQTIGARGTSFTLCSLPASTSVTATLAAMNRKGTSATVQVAFTTNPANSGTTPASSCSPINSSPFYMNTGGTNLTTYAQNVVLAVPVVLSLILAIVVGGCVTYCLHDPTSQYRARCLHRSCKASMRVRLGLDKASAAGAQQKPASSASTAPAPAAATASAAANQTGKQNAARSRGSGFLTSAIHYLTPMRWSEAGLAWFLTAIAVLVVFGITWAAAWSFFSIYLPNAYANGLTLPLYRSAGYVLLLAMSVVLWPPAKNSLWAYIFGASFERAIRIHRVVAFVVTVMILVHGFGMGLAFANQYGASFCFTSNTAAPVNILPGTLAGIFMGLMIVLAMEPVRRKFYSLFLFSHNLLWPIAVLCGAIHLTNSSVFNPWPPLAIGVAPLVLDYLWRFYSVYGRGTAVVDVDVVMRKAGSSGEEEPDVACLWLRKPDLPGGGGDAPEGSFYYLYAPGISMIAAHPFSLSSPPLGHKASSGQGFTLHIKSGREGSFTHELVKRINAVVQSRNSALQEQQQEQPSSLLGRYLGKAGAGKAGGSPLVMPQGAKALLPTIHVHGPFGRLSFRPGLEAYRHVILFAGGIGITAIAGTHHATASRILASRSNANAAGSSMSLTTVWSVREAGLLNEFAPLLAAATSSAMTAASASANPAGALAYYSSHAAGDPEEGTAGGAAVRPAGAAALATTNSGKADAAAAIASAAVGRGISLNVHYTSPGQGSGQLAPEIVRFVRKGRANVRGLFSEVIQGVSSAGDTSASVAVVVCGPSALVEEVHAAAASLSSSSGIRFDVHTEVFEF